MDRLAPLPPWLSSMLLRLPPLLGPYQFAAVGALSIGTLFIVHSQIGRLLGVH